MHNAGEDERFHGIESEEVHRHRQHSEHSDRRVEFFRFRWFSVEAVFPSDDLTQIVSSARRHDRHSEKADADHAQSKQDRRGVTSQRPERFCRFRRGVDFRRAALKSVDAVENTMKYITRFEKNMPEMTSSFVSFSSFLVAPIARSRQPYRRGLHRLR